jgi:hypothetical protein
VGIGGKQAGDMDRNDFTEHISSYDKKVKDEKSN